MPARDLAEPYPHVTTDDTAVDAVRLLAEQNLPALLVLDADGTPYAVVPGSQLVRQLVPEYVMEDPLLAAVIDDRHAEALADDLAGKTVAEWLPRRTFKPPYVGPDAGALQIAAVMARSHVPLVAVIERDGEESRLLGVVTAAALMRHLLASGGQA
ncbi:MULTISPECIES: CBS domain-containing protein [unclassified Streptomyces]|uniref:CBS domain-containing protein n=1 Tax=Streptomyces TaxID=1883 RepID=UPI001623D746|nr:MULTISPECIES: CBS domain-containing protein [unclassified Streptomyces]MCM1971291.1 CBS domain-containing protein [Streptomyces sp. G1]QNE26204.1 CBS domain-containing protein [Streptomyces sp. INR7]